MGCDRQQASCQTRLQADGISIDNSQHYRGFPFVPGREALLRIQSLTVVG